MKLKAHVGIKDPVMPYGQMLHCGLQNCTLRLVPKSTPLGFSLSKRKGPETETLTDGSKYSWRRINLHHETTS